MKGTASYLLEFLEGSRKRFIIPVYQRNYDWKRENCKQLFDDLVSVIKEGKSTHFFGSIVSYAHSKDEVVLIDGQQRITTISLILIAMINAMKRGACVPEDSRLAEILEDTYIVDKYRRDERKVRLKPFRDDCTAFDRLIYNEEEEYIQESKVTINYKYFYDRIGSGNELDGFVRNYLTIKTGAIPNLRRIYFSFKDYTKRFENIEEVLEDMLVYALSYRDIREFQIGERDTNEIVKRLDLLDMTVAYPFLMAFLVYAKEVDLPATEIFKVFSCIETFIFRRLMCDLPTNALNKIFATLHISVLKNKKDADNYSSVMIYILESKKLSSSFPKDEEFINGFTTKKVYSMQAKNKMYIFERLENGSSVEKNDVVGNIEQGILTIEHIMPQTLNNAWKQELGLYWENIQEKWLHTISNLTLSGYNIKYSNRPFAEKRDMENGFKESGLRMNHYIAQFSKWTEEELEQRKQELSRMAKTIWPYPETDFIPEVQDEDIVNLSEDNGISTGRKIQYYIFQDEREDVVEWSEMMWAIINRLYNINPDILYEEAKGSKNVWFTTSKTTKNYKKVAEGLYFCPSKNSTWNKMAILKNLFRLYQIDEDDLQFGLKPIKQ